MKELIAKRYIKALKEAIGESALENAAVLFDALASEFAKKEFAQLMENPSVSKSEKLEILQSAVKAAKSEAVNNFLALLVENGRINIIPEIADELNKEIARLTKSYSGNVYSKDEIDAATLEGLSAGLGKKVDANIALSFTKSDYDGIKVEVGDLGIEINFSKNRVNTQLIDHILKAI
jgi:F-type H+-transporting ATPase subunit delta